MPATLTPVLMSDQKLSTSQLAHLQNVTARAPILVSDDDTMTRALYRAILERAGLSYLDTWNASEALSICQNQPISLIISDIRNQDMNGLDMLQLLRDNPDTQNVPLLFITATQDTRSVAFELGANGYLSKPFAPAEILIEIWQLIGIA